MVGAILKDVRISRGYSLRTWSDWIKSQFDVSFTHSDIQRYENAGLKKDKRAQVPASVAPMYLEIVAPLTPYPLEFLKEVLDGKYTGAVKPTKLEDLIEERYQAVGDFEFKQLRQKYAISDEIVIRAKNGMIAIGDDGKLAEFLRTPPSEVWRAAISQLDNHNSTELSGDEHKSSN